MTRKIKKGPVVNLKLDKLEKEIKVRLNLHLCKYCGEDCDDNPCEKRVAIAKKVISDLVTHEWERHTVIWICKKCGTETGGNKYVKPCNQILMERALM